MAQDDTNNTSGKSLLGSALGIFNRQNPQQPAADTNPIVTDPVSTTPADTPPPPMATDPMSAAVSTPTSPAVEPTAPLSEPQIAPIQETPTSTPNISMADLQAPISTETLVSSPMESTNLQSPDVPAFNLPSQQNEAVAPVSPTPVAEPAMIPPQPNMSTTESTPISSTPPAPTPEASASDGLPQVPPPIPVVEVPSAAEMLAELPGANPTENTTATEPTVAAPIADETIPVQTPATTPQVEVATSETPMTVTDNSSSSPDIINTGLPFKGQ